MKKITITISIVLSLLKVIYSTTSDDLNPYSKDLEDYEEDGIYMLKDINYDTFISTYKYSLLFLYTHPCYLCKQIIPELKKTSELLNQLETVVKIGVVNCTDSDSEQIKRRLVINGNKVLSMKYISEGMPMNYTGGRTSSEMISWIRSNLNPVIGEIKSVKELSELTQVVRVMAVYFGEEDDTFNNFQKVAKSFSSDVLFLRCRSSECMDYYEVNNGNVILFKKYDEKQKKFDMADYTVEELTDFIEDSYRSTVLSFDFKTASLIFEKHVPGLFIYRSKSGDDKYLQLLNEIAPVIKNEFKSKLQPVITDLVDIAEGKLADMMGIKETDLPLVMIHNTRGNLIKNYKMTDVDGEFKIIDKESVLRFVKMWEMFKEISSDPGQDSPLNKFRYIKSKEVPVNQTDSSYILVGSTLEKFVMDPTKDVVVIFYAPWCKYSKEFLPIYEKVANALKESNKNLLMAKFDAHYNDPSVYTLSYYPTVVLWRADNKKEVIEFKFERTEENLIQFLKANTAYGVTEEVVA